MNLNTTISNINHAESAAISRLKIADALPFSRALSIVQWKKPSRPKWMTQEEYDKFPGEIKIREISIENKRDGFRAKKRILVTTFLNPQTVSKSDLEELYSYRWFVELSLRSIKSTMHIDILRGKTPGMVRKEI